MRNIYRLIPLSLLILFALTTCSQEEVPWGERIVYFILIDRYVDGDPGNNDGGIPESYWPYDGSHPEALKHYQGGDLQGIIQNLDILKSMGITALWLSPFLDNSNTDYVGWWPYHGYQPIDFRSVDEHFGTLDDLKELVTAAHARKMKIIFDMPFNQVSADHPWLSNPAKHDWFHWDSAGNPLEIKDWYDQVQIETGELHGLPDLAQENPDVYDYLLETSRYWITETGCDGFRLDAVKHIPRGFWEKYNQDVRSFAGPDFLLLGEVFWGEPERLQPYLSLGFDAFFDIPGYYTLNRVFARNAPLWELSDYLQHSTALFQDEIRATLLDNHDVARFNTDLGKQGWPRTRVALTWLLTSPGMPVLTYGTDVGMTGAPVRDARTHSPQDYLNRKMYPDKLDLRQSAHRLETMGLMQMRHNKPALESGAFHELYRDYSIYAYLRSTEDQTMLVVLSTAATQEWVSIPLPSGMKMSGDPLKMMGDGSARTMEAAIYLKLPPFAAGIWELPAKLPPDLPTWVAPTERYSKDFMDITLTFRTQQSVEHIQVAGDFTNWQPRDYPVERRGDTLSLQLKLKPGQYEYKLVLDDSLWIANPDGAMGSTDPYGGTNSLLRVP